MHQNQYKSSPVVLSFNFGVSLYGIFDFIMAWKTNLYVFSPLRERCGEDNSYFECLLMF